MQDCALDFVWEVQDEEEVQENHEEQVPEKNLWKGSLKYIYIYI